MNVVRPAGAKPGQKLPVMVWIHGGAYVIGTSMGAFGADTEGTNFAKRGDPNGPGVPAWPQWNAPGEKRLMRINAAAAAEPERDRARFEFLERLERRRHSGGR